jgi:16S rRNA (cytosine1402-N4)-methyltransferase
MSSEISQYLIKNPDGLYVDCTFGGGGHTLYLLNNFRNIKIIAFDWDEASLNEFFKNKNEFKGRVVFIRDNFKNIKKNLSIMNINKVDGILADLGVSSKQLDDLNRGFSFNSHILDMRMDNRNYLTAKEIVNSYSYEDLVDIFYHYGEEYRSKYIARAILLYRKKKIINTALELKAIVCSVKKIRKKINPATKVFQALRIFTNKELENLKILLSDAQKLLNNNGRIVVMAFHSLEDRIVKQNFRQNSCCGVYNIITKKIIRASQKEIAINPRSRSAKVRVAERINV